MQKQEPIPKFIQIDSLRGIAAVMVVLVHALLFGHNNSFPAFLTNFVYQGQRGVQLFYIISAFTLYYTFGIRKSEQHSTLKFLLRRFFRIAPLYYFAIVLYLIVRDSVLNHELTADYPSYINVISNFVFLHGISPYWIDNIVPGGWSIGVEFPFYFMLPLLFVYVKSLTAALRCQVCFLTLGIVVPVIMLQIRGLAPHETWISFVNHFLPNQLAHFGFGIILYFLIVKKEEFTAKHFNLFYIIILQYFVFISLSMYYLHSYWLVHNIVLSMLFSLGFTVFIFLLFKDDRLKLDYPILLFLGKISYGLYLTNFFSYYILDYFHLNDLLPGNSGTVATLNLLIRFGLCLVLSSGLSYFLYLVLERPFQNLGRRFIAKLP